MTPREFAYACLWGIVAWLALVNLALLVLAGARAV